ncbi:MAG: hypothetical protein KF795_32880 [Labilithrix sp.]|nr:hypothetical protein [Labilithrix sp.]
MSADTETGGSGAGGAGEEPERAEAEARSPRAGSAAWRANLGLFLATAASVFVTGVASFPHEGSLLGADALIQGAQFAGTILTILVAHELGHYVGGDTKLTGVLAYTEGAFRSVLASTERNALREGTTHWAIDVGGWIASVVGEGLVKVFARVYLGLTRPMSRR